MRDSCRPPRISEHHIPGRSQKTREKRFSLSLEQSPSSQRNCLLKQRESRFKRAVDNNRMSLLRPSHTSIPIKLRVESRQTYQHNKTERFSRDDGQVISANCKLVLPPRPSSAPVSRARAVPSRAVEVYRPQWYFRSAPEHFYRRTYESTRTQYLHSRDNLRNGQLNLQELATSH